MSARIICFDGPDGTGKSTQLALAKEALEKLGHKVYTTRTPGGTPIGEVLREAFLSHTERPPKTDLHIVWGMELAISDELDKKRGDYDYILIDRGPLAFLAYQVFGSGLDMDYGMRAVQEVIDDWQPDIMFLLTAPWEISKKRLHDSKAKLDYFESKSDNYHEKVQAGYEAGKQQFKVTIINATPDIDTVHNAIMKQIQAL